jgi:hypothetical protein
MRQYGLIVLGMFLASIAPSAKAQDAMMQQKPAEKKQSITSTDKANPPGNSATAARKLTDKSTDATITDPANTATNVDAEKH